VIVYVRLCLVYCSFSFCCSLTEVYYTKPLRHHHRLLSECCLMQTSMSTLVPRYWLGYHQFAVNILCMTWCFTSSITLLRTSISVLWYY